MDVMKVFKWLSDEEKMAYSDFETTFGTKGWKRIVEMAEQDKETALRAGADAQSWESNRIMFGRRLQLEALLAMPESVDNYYEGLAAEREAEEYNPDEPDFEAEENFE